VVRRASSSLVLRLACVLVAGAWAVAGEAPLEPSKSSSSWARVRDALDRYRAVVDTSGFVEVAEAPRPPDPEDLVALCEAQREGVVLARQRAEAELRMIAGWEDPVTVEKRAELHRVLGSVASFEGRMDAAATEFDRGREALASSLAEYPDLRPQFLDLLEAAGVASMRQGEVDNCMVNSSADRCLFPLRPGGYHGRPRGAQVAIERFQERLAMDPDNVDVRWLLNLAYMVLGRYPQDVPRSALIPPAAFSSDAAMPRFVDVAPQVGLGHSDISGGTIIEDFDGDGLLDVAFSSVDHCSALGLYRNRGDGTFEDRSGQAGVLGQLGGLNIVQTDYNNDGRLDIFVMRGGWQMPMRNSLLRNNGDGTFTDVTRTAGLFSGAHATHSAAWADFDDDGWLDVFVGHELTPSQLFRNRHDGTFEDVTARAGVGANAFTKGATWGDYDKDGFPDLYVSNFVGDNFLYHNNGDGTFTDVAGKLGVQKPLMSFPTWFFDYDNDGWLDIFVASYVPSLSEFVKHYLGIPPSAETLTLYRNLGNGTFEDVTRETGLARVVPTMGTNFGDLDNDGFLDMYLGTGAPSYGALMPNIMLKNDRGRRFLDVTEATGTGHLQKGHGIAFADLDDDGDEDVVLNVGGAVPGDSYDEVLFENPGGYGNNWISLELVGVKTNRAAIGTRITLRLSGAGEGSAERYREVTSGGSFGSSSLVQHIGVGRARTIDSLEVFWPVSRTTQAFHDVPVNRFLQIRELDDAWHERNPPRVTFARRAP
jgi:hypothetical protein